MSRQFMAGFAAVTILSICSCGPSETPTREKIFKARQTIDTLYLTEDGREIIAPGNADGAIVDPETGKIAWAAYQCNNPKCPGRKDGRPFLFPWPSPFAYVTEEGTIGYRTPEDVDEATAMTEKFAMIECPACAKIRNRDKETPEQRQQYEQWCKPYVLPESAKRLKALDEELRLLVKEQKE